MTTLHLYRGLPGAGKTTRAVADVAAAVRQGRRVVRVNRDNLRDMVHAGCYDPANPAVTEAAVTVAQHAAIRALLAAGWDVVCDDTNLKPEVFDALVTLAANAGAGVNVIDMRHVPVEVCVARDAGRPETWPAVCSGARVTAAVIRGMAERHLGPTVDGLPGG